MADEATEDEREEEISSIAAIFPELAIDPANPFVASLEIPVAPSIPIKVRFPPPLDGSIHNTLPVGTITDDGTGINKLPSGEDTHELSYFPPLQLRLSLPDGYPSDKAPSVQLSTSPDWLPERTLEELKEQAAALWEEYGHMQVVFAYIDFLQQSAENGFDLSSQFNGIVDIDQDMKISLLDFDIRTKRQKFERETFDCGICLEPKKGSSCYRLQKCGHVFCVACLQDFYLNAITEGDIASVKCLAPDCGVQRDNNTRRAKKAARTLGPNELLQIPLERSLVQRYVDLKRKKKLESSKDTVYCPRQWCQGPAGPKRYIKKELSQMDDEDSASESEAPLATGQKTEQKVQTSQDRLRICETCDYAFCRICLTGWHGEFVRCWPKSAAELNEEEQKSYDYIRMHTSPCPTCSSPCQKTHGCNHMNCYQCNTHFCYLCSMWLDPQNPYSHFNDKKIGCYQRLWELEEGDDGNGEVRFEGARGWEAAVAAADEADEAERPPQGEGQQQLQDAPRAVIVLEEEQHDEAQAVVLAGGQAVVEPQAGPIAEVNPVAVPFIVDDANLDLDSDSDDFVWSSDEDEAGLPGGRNPIYQARPPGQPRHRQRRPMLGGVVPIRQRGGHHHNGRIHRHGGGDVGREMAGLGQQNYLRMVRGEDEEEEGHEGEILEDRVEEADGGQDDMIEERDGPEPVHADNAAPAVYAGHIPPHPHGGFGRGRGRDQGPRDRGRGRGRGAGRGHGRGEW